MRAEAEVRRRAEEDARKRAEDEARRRAQEEAERLAAEQARRAAEEQVRRQAEEEQRRRREEDARRVAQEVAQSRAEENARLRAEQDERQREEAERRQQAELEARIRAEVAAKLRAEEAERQRADLRDDTEFARTSGEWFRGGEESEFQPVSIPEAEETMVPVATASSLDTRNHKDRAAAVRELGSHGSEDAFDQITEAFDDPAPEVRNAAARALFDFQEDRAAAFTRALRDASIDRRARIGAAIAESGLADQAINNLTGESRDRTYDAFSLLFLMSKSGELNPLMRAIEEHPSTEARLAVIKLLALSGQPEVLPAFRRLAVRGSLPPDVRSAVMEAIYQISGQTSGEGTPTN
jgi:hypothetical protein